MRYSLAIAAAVMASAAVASPVPQPGMQYEYKVVNVYTTETQTAGPKVVTQTAPAVTVTQNAPAATSDSNKEWKWEHHGNYDGAKSWATTWEYSYEVKPSQTKAKEVKPTTSAPPPAATTKAAVATTTKAAAAQPSPTQADNSDSSLNGECLKSHNDARAKHGAAALTWNSTMADYALEKVSKTCVFEHSHGPYGENLAMGYKTAAEAIAAWYDEEKMYDYAAGQFSSATGHFTQMVWKSAKQVGCGSYECPGKGNFLTCNYDTGNVISQFVENVLPPTSSSY